MECLISKKIENSRWEEYNFSVIIIRKETDPCFMK